ncbi:MAG: type II toxin-antitoxin system RelE/ParE family toxin [Nitrospinae bacterium]|nr:type II toxin-antitoxin system RelE/ParE family toxin [Nitrospinota bacterium]
MYKILYSREAAKTMLKIPRNTARRIREKLEALAANPFTKNNNVTELAGQDAYRLRIGDWRAIYSIRRNALEILVVKVAPRGGAYK